MATTPPGPTNRLTMADIAADVLAYGLAAGLSGTAFLATAIVLSTDRGPANAVALLVGFLVVLVPAVVAAAILTDVLTAPGGQQVVVTSVQLALGILLLSTAWRVRPGRGDGPDIGAKVAVMTTRAQALEPRTAARLGIGLAVLPKRLVITLLAGAAIGASGVSVSQGLTLTVLYVLTATSLIWITLAAFVLGGERARSGLDDARAWVTANAETLAFVVTLLFGVLFTGGAIAGLVWS